MRINTCDSLFPEKGNFYSAHDVFYYKSNVDHAFYQNFIAEFGQSAKNANKGESLGFHTLEFKYNFLENNQIVRFSYSYPYSFT